MSEVVSNLDLILSSNVSEDSLKDCSRLTKGYFYEMSIQNLCSKKNIDSIGNPKQYEEWLRYTNTGYDVKILNAQNSWIRVECKFTLTPIFHSWFLRDWLSRDSDIIVTNNKYSLSYRDRRILELYGKKLMSTTEFIMYLDRLKTVTNTVVFECSTVNNNSISSDTSSNNVPVSTTSQHKTINKPNSKSEDSRSSLPNSGIEGLDLQVLRNEGPSIFLRFRRLRQYTNYSIGSGTMIRIVYICNHILRSLCRILRTRRRSV